VNRHQTETLDLEVDLAGFDAKSIERHITIQNNDLRATNASKHPDRVAPSKGTGVGVVDRAVKGKVAPNSYHVIRVAV
jgi:alpha-N-arabinofuranosidase